MAKLSKRVRAFREKVDANHSYPLDEAVALIKEFGTVKFNETVEVAVNLGVDARKSDQGVRGATTLPHGTGADVRVAVFTQGDSAEKAKALGAEFVGMEDLAEQIKGGMMDFDVVIASPDAMRVVGTLGQVLGPRGLMPNPKTGTVTPDIETAVNNAKAGQMRFRSDKNGIVHGGIGKVNFEPDAIKGNFVAVLADLKKAKPASAKGVYVRKSDAVDDDGARASPSITTRSNFKQCIKATGVSRGQEPPCVSRRVGRSAVRLRPLWKSLQERVGNPAERQRLSKTVGGTSKGP